MARESTLQYPASVDRNDRQVRIVANASVGLDENFLAVLHDNTDASMTAIRWQRFTSDMGVTRQVSPLRPCLSLPASSLPCQAPPTSTLCASSHAQKSASAGRLTGLYPHVPNTAAETAVSGLLLRIIAADYCSGLLLRITAADSCTGLKSLRSATSLTLLTRHSNFATPALKQASVAILYRELPQAFRGAKFIYINLTRAAQLTRRVVPVRSFPPPSTTAAATSGLRPGTARPRRWR